VNNSPQSFAALLNQFLACYQQNDYAQALELLEIEGPRFPENAVPLMAWQAAMLARLGRVNEAVQVLQSADAQGHWYHEDALRQDPDFAPLQGCPGFADLVQRMVARRLADAAQDIPVQQVIAPPGSGPHPLCLVLHGMESNASMMVPYWGSIVEQGWTLAALQSLQPAWASGIFVWEDIPKALAQIKTQTAGLLAQYPVDPQAVIVGGFSMGASIAVRMALDPDFQLRGIIALEAWFTDEDIAELEQIIRSTPQPRARVLLIAGQENEQYIQMAQKVQALLARRGTPCRVVRASNTDHSFPPEFPQLLRQAVDWIMGTAES